MQLIAGGLSVVVDLVVLDKDGTMFELDSAWSRMASSWEDRIESLTGLPGLAAAIAEHIGHDKTTGEVVPGSVLAAGTMQQLREAMAAVIVSRRGDPTIVETVVVPSPGNLTPKGDVAGWLRRSRSLGARVGVLTADDRAGTCTDLDNAAIADLIDDLVAGDDGYPPKPHPAGLLVLCDRLHSEPAQAVMIGDSPIDMEAATAAGVTAIGIRSRSGVVPVGAAAAVTSLDEIELLP